MGNNFDEIAALKLAKNKNASAEALKTLVGKSDRVDRLIAQHQNADSVVLGKLTGSNDTRTRKLVLENSNFEKLLITQPAIIRQMGKMGEIWIGSQLERPDIPTYLIDWAISQQAGQWLPEEILQTLWENPLVPDDLFKVKEIEDSFFNYQIAELEKDIAKGKFLVELGLDVRVATPEDIKEFERCGYVVSLDGGKSYDTVSLSVSDIRGKELQKLWDVLIPPTGDAQTVQGQFGCIVYRFSNEYYRNGLMNWVHEIYDDEFCYRGLVEFLEDRLVDEKPFNTAATAHLADILKQLFYQYYPAQIDIFHESDFETLMEYLKLSIYAYSVKYPNLIPNDEPEKCDIAKSHEIEQDTLEKLARDVSSKVRSLVASNSICSVDTLRTLSADRSVRVRLAVANNKKSPVDALERLSTDANINVRCAIGRRKDFPVTKQKEFVSEQFALIFSSSWGDSKSTEWSAQTCDIRKLPFDVWNPKLCELFCQLAPVFFLEELAALLEWHVDQRDGDEDALWCCRRALYFIFNNENAPLLSKRLIEKYPDITAWDDYDEIGELVRIVEDQKTASGELAGLIGINVKIDRRIAKHQNATREILALLSNSTDRFVLQNLDKRMNQG